MLDVHVLIIANILLKGKMLNCNFLGRPTKCISFLLQNVVSDLTLPNIQPGAGMAYSV
jgi:hypothetical protein